MSNNIKESKEHIKNHQLTRFVVEGEEPITLAMYRERKRRINRVLAFVTIAFIFGALSYSLGAIDSHQIYDFNDETLFTIRSFLSTTSSILGISAIITIYQARKSVIREEIRDRRLSQKNL